MALSGEAQYQVNDFRLRFNGKATDYALSTRANLKGGICRRRC